MNKTTITLPDGTKKSFDFEPTGYDIAKSIGEGLLRDSIAVRMNNQIIDLHVPVLNNSKVEIITKKSLESHEILLHSTAHLLAQAIKENYPEAKIAIGPALKETFYYDIDLDISINEEDLEKLEKTMKKIAKQNIPVERKELTQKDALDIFKKRNENYKIEIITQINKEDMISTYKQGDFIDLCRGPHIPSTGKIKYFKLLSIAGAYWRGDEKNKMLQRIYGTSWYSKEDLDDYLYRLDEAKKRDHRKIGKELEIFSFDEEVGPGLPLWLPNGAIIIEELENLAKETEKKANYFRVKTPHLTKGQLYEKSGHLKHYKDSMFPAMNVDGIDYYVKPMNCPHHHKIFSASPKSYRDLPYRLAEYGTCYRYEKSGQLFGLMRVRSMQMNDAHIYCTKEQFQDEFIKVCNMYLYYFNVFNIEKYEMRLSLHDKEGLGKKYFNEPELWESTEESVRNALNEAKLNYTEVPGEAAFYGPKIDVQVWSAIGKEFTLSTNQVDFVVPQQFGLNYIDENNKKQTPLCIHRAPLSTHERFIGFLIEHFGGDFPVWLTPKQVVILPVSQKHFNYALEIKDLYYKYNIRVNVDIRNEKIGAKIRDAEISKIPIMLIVGDKEMKNQSVSLRRRGKGNLGVVDYKELVKEISLEIQNREGVNK